MDDEERIAALVQEEMGKTIDLARLSAAIAALLTNQDVNIADMAGTNAVENNSLQDLQVQIERAIKNLHLEAMADAALDFIADSFDSIADFAEYCKADAELYSYMILAGFSNMQDDKGIGKAPIKGSDGMA